MRIHGQVDPDVLGLLGVGHRLAVGRGAVGLHRLADQPDVQVETHTGDMAGLLDSEHVAGPANLSPQFNCHAGTQLVVLCDGGQPVVGGLGERVSRG